MFEALDFSEIRYRKLLRLSLEKGYQPAFFGEEDKHRKGRFILWRHDVDIDLCPTVKMAKIEKEEGIKSTYFFMLNSGFYNLLTKNGEETIEQIKKSGHRVGLHCNLGIERNGILEDRLVCKKVDQSFEILELFFGKHIFDRTVSFHNPPRNILKKSFDTFYSTYQKKFFGPIKYLSDSNRMWVEGPPEKWLQKDEITAFSILSHPIIWAHKGTTMPDLVKGYLNHLRRCTVDKLMEDEVLVK